MIYGFRKKPKRSSASGELLKSHNGPSPEFAIVTTRHRRFSLIDAQVAITGTVANNPDLQEHVIPIVEGDPFELSSGSTPIVIGKDDAMEHIARCRSDTAA